MSNNNSNGHNINRPIDLNETIAQLSKIHTNYSINNNKIYKVDKDYIAQYSNKPKSSNEIIISINDRIHLLEAYNDGRGFGKNVTNGQIGFLPLNCLDNDRFDDLRKKNIDEYNYNKNNNNNNNGNKNNIIDNDHSIKNVIKVTDKHFMEKNINDNLIQAYLIAIDNKNKTEIEILYNEYNKYSIKKDIIYEMYNENKLTSERLQFIVENCSAYLNISSFLIKKLIKDNNKELLEILFNNHFKFFDNEFILYLTSKL